MKSFIAAIQDDAEGFVVRNSVFLPFHCEIISIWVGKELSFVSAPDLITDLGDTRSVWIREGESYTNLVFRKWDDLGAELGHRKGHVIMHVAEKGADIFQAANLHFIRISFLDDRRHITFEIVDDPFRL